MSGEKLQAEKSWSHVWKEHMMPRHLASVLTSNQQNKPAGLATSWLGNLLQGEHRPADVHSICSLEPVRP